MIAAGMSVCIVYVFEIIHVQDQHGYPVGFQMQRFQPVPAAVTYGSLI